MKTIYIRETKSTCDIVKRILLKLKKLLNIIKTNNNVDIRIYYLPIFKESKVSKYRIKKFAQKISSLLEKERVHTIVLSDVLYNNQLLKNYLYSKNINILNGRFLFKCLTYKIIEYLFKIRNKKIEMRRSYITS